MLSSIMLKKSIDGIKCASLQVTVVPAAEKETFVDCVCSLRPPHSIETLSAAADKASGIPAYLPNCLLLKDTIRKASEWLQESEELQV